MLDSWAVLRYLEGADPAATAVSELLETERPLMSWINLGEVFYILCRRFGEDEAAETVRDLQAAIDVRLPDERLVLSAARAKAANPMAYADAFAAALAMRFNATLWTGDPELLLDECDWRWRDLRND